MILVTGASGNVGSAVLQELLRAGAPVRTLYRSGEDASKAPAGANAVIADFADRASLDRALQGIDRVFLVCSPIPQLVELESNVVEACRQHGIQHLVQNSALGASAYDKSFPGWHYEVEKRVRASGIPATILRPESFMQNIPAFFAGTINSQRAFYAATGHAPIGFVDLRDVAAVAAKVLTTDSHMGETYTLTGPEALTYTQVAEKLSALLGTPVRYVDLTQEQLRQSMRDMGIPPWQVEALADLQAYYTDGPGAKVTGDVQEVLGRGPIPFDQFLRDYAAAFTRPTAQA
ncbi:MAG TPA: SDR family oxidoreductase [Candidatus Eisenbacteria bacterium]|nr:SDR family oxidoreductase [Candidatus Eisenbacteria bacterium]